MDNEIFYAFPQNGIDKTNQKPLFDKTKAIPAKFLIVNGKPVIDPNPCGSMQPHIYSRLNSTGSIDESSISSNPHNYLIVPANYDPSEASNLAAGVDSSMTHNAVHAVPVIGEVVGLAVGAAAMTTAFLPGHEQDLQRGERWGIPQGETSPAFRDAASWNLGYVTQMTPLPNAAAVVGGGVLNTGEYARGLLKHAFGGSSPTQKLNGPMGMSKTDYRAFLKGIESGNETENLEGKTPLEKLRYYAAEARTNAAKAFVSEHMKLQHILTNRRQPQRSYAPTPSRQNGRTQHAAQGDAGSSGGSELAQSSLALKMDALLQTLRPGGPEAVAVSSGNTAQSIAATNSASIAQGIEAGPGALSSSAFQPAGTNAMRSMAGMGGALALRVKSRSPGAQPSFAPPISRAPGGGERLQQGAPWAEGGPLPRGSANVQTSETLAPRAQNRAAATSDAFAADFNHSTEPQEFDLDQALKNYFFRQSRLPPAARTAFDPRLTPAWAGLKIPS